MSPRVLISLVASAALIIPMGLSPAAAQTPRDLRDLVGARAGQAENSVRQRGYVFARAQQDSTSSYTYWTRGDTCVQITTNDGRYAAIDTMSRSTCNSSSGGGSTAGAVIAGAAIIGLAAALAAHKKKKSGTTGQSYDDEYSRGYQDALYGSHYDEDDSEAYHDGYMAGDAERSNRRASNTSYMRSAAPADARRACEARGDEFQNLPPGSSSAVSASSIGGGRYEIVVASGHYRSRCTVDGRGRVLEMNPY